MRALVTGVTAVPGLQALVDFEMRHRPQYHKMWYRRR